MYKDYLTESARRKTDRLIEKKRALINSIKKEKIYLCLLFIFVLYFFIMDNALLHNTFALIYSIFTFLYGSDPDYLKLGFLDKTILVSLILTFILVIHQASIIRKLKNEYEKLRIDIIVQMEHCFCFHKDKCDCIDKYILEMDKHEIDVVFR